MTLTMEIRSLRRCGEGADRAAELFTLFKSLGGIIDGHEATEELRRSQSQPLSVLARWIVNRQVFHFTWQSTMLLPRFQFGSLESDAVVHAPVPGVKRVLIELDEQFDELEIAEWFASPNTWLHLSIPALLIARDADVVVSAARADRYIAKGW